MCRCACEPASTLSSILQLILLGAIWGASFMFQRISVGDFGPVPLVEARLVLGSLVLLPFLWRDRAQFSLRRLPMMALIGAINSGSAFPAVRVGSGTRASRRRRHRQWHDGPVCRTGRFPVFQ